MNRGREYRDVRQDECEIWIGTQAIARVQADAAKMTGLPIEKIVVHNRGGFCYELNGGFAWLLRQLGFEVTYLNARVYSRDGRLGMEFDHLALLVSIAGSTDRWLADVGFGDSFV